jgi:hypothetical protein
LLIFVFSSALLFLGIWVKWCEKYFLFKSKEDQNLH